MGKAGQMKGKRQKAASLRSEGKGQKAKGKRQKGGALRAFLDSSRSDTFLLPFAFCLLPFAFPQGRLLPFAFCLLPSRDRGFRLPADRRAERDVAGSVH
jgi:hypothetical protein